ncbi:hypothetical protein TNCT_713681 [Trichonephila clavata]|uniref:Uncharacterized protein n=1 Tax=Trichonephila clavata TaxID=2740835 RepID=A0A8X6KZW3_TRICU|nr:hypothetical protein TNCT_713681 [Trichonephila clavata]
MLRNNSKIKFKITSKSVLWTGQTSTPMPSVCGPKPLQIRSEDFGEPTRLSDTTSQLYDSSNTKLILNSIKTWRSERSKSLQRPPRQNFTNLSEISVLLAI